MPLAQLKDILDRACKKSFIMYISYFHSVLLDTKSLEILKYEILLFFARYFFSIFFEICLILNLDLAFVYNWELIRLLCCFNFPLCHYHHRSCCCSNISQHYDSYPYLVFVSSIQTNRMNTSHSKFWRMIYFWTYLQRLTTSFLLLLVRQTCVYEKHVAA